MHRALEVQERMVEGVTVLSMGGVIDSDSLNTFSSLMDRLCAQAGARVVMDFRDLGYVNSCCLGLLNKYNSRFSAHGGRLAFCRIPEKIVQIVRLLGLDQTLTIRGTIPEAVVAVK